MELYHYLAIVRRRWPIVVGLPLIVGLISLVGAISRPTRYEVTTRMLVTHTDLLSVGVNEHSLPVEDTIAYDLPSIINSDLFARDVADELARRNHPLSPELIRQSLSAKNKYRPVELTVTTTNPQDALPIANAVLDLIKRNGLRYWGDQTATPEEPGINVVVLDDLPSQPIPSNNIREVALEIALRSLAALIVALGIVFGLHYLVAGDRLARELA